MRQIKTYILSSVLFLSLLLSACAPAVPGQQSSASEESGNSGAASAVLEREIGQRAADYVAEFQNGNFAAVLANGSSELISNCTEDSLRTAWEACQRDARAFQRQEEPEVTCLEKGYLADVYCVHARYRILSKMTFDKEGAVSDVSFSLKPLIVLPEESDTWAEEPITLGYDAEKQLNGMLTLPKNTENPPVVIHVQGSGKGSMDSLIGCRR